MAMKGRRVGDAWTCRRPVRQFYLLFAPLLISVAVVAEDCSSGVLQATAWPQGESDCFVGILAPKLDTNSIKAICTTALRVTVKAGIVTIVPLELRTFTYSDITIGGLFEYPFNCKDANASGLFFPGSTTAASVMLWDDYGGPLSNLTKTGPDQITFSMAHTYAYKDENPSCAFNYTVVSGCVFGIKAPASQLPTCVGGFYPAAGRFNTSYCAPCPPGSYSPAGASACSLCPIGTYSKRYGSAECTKCPAGRYADKQGSTSCAGCTTSATTNKYISSDQKCRACPAGSYVPDLMRAQCVKCAAGKRCCTIGWDSNCPKCAAGVTALTYSSIFALDSATPTCLATGHAICNPKFRITIGGSCTVELDNLDNFTLFAGRFCSWKLKFILNGSAFNAATDLAKFDGWVDDATSLPSGFFTSFKSPYVTVAIPATNCSLRYRVLTSPAAALMGAAPKPGTAGACPAGQYQETNTDVKPGPCLPCPPGRFSSSPSSGRACSPCRAGTYAKGYGSTQCAKCPAGLYARAASPSCSYCPRGSFAAAGGKSCVACPKNSDTYYQGAGAACLANSLGTICCAAGNCTGQTPCTTPLEAARGWVIYFAVAQLSSKSTTQPACKGSLLSCLPAGAKLTFAVRSLSPLALDVSITEVGKCGGDVGVVSLGGYYAGSRSAYVAEPLGRAPTVGYGMLADAAKGTIKMYLAPLFRSNNSTLVTVIPPAVPGADCSATFQLKSGYAFDLAPPAGAQCGAAEEAKVIGGKAFCAPCIALQFKDSAGKCRYCSAGTYLHTAKAGTSCTPCPPGYYCYQGTDMPVPCSAGTFAAKPQQALCKQCPANTFSSSAARACTACPKGQVALKNAAACGIPWPKQF